MSKIKIKYMDKAKLLMWLFNKATLICDRYYFTIHGNMDLERAKKQIQIQQERYGNLEFDILDARPLFIDISGDYLDTTLYNKHNGENAAEKVIESDFYQIFEYKYLLNFLFLQESTYVSDHIKFIISTFYNNFVVWLVTEYNILPKFVYDNRYDLGNHCHFEFEFHNKNIFIEFKFSDWKNVSTYYDDNESNVNELNILFYVWETFSFQIGTDTNNYDIEYFLKRLKLILNDIEKEERCQSSD